MCFPVKGPKRSLARLIPLRRCRGSGGSAETKPILLEIGRGKSHTLNSQVVCIRPNIQSTPRRRGVCYAPSAVPRPSLLFSISALDRLMQHLWLRIRFDISNQHDAARPNCRAIVRLVQIITRSYRGTFYRQSDKRSLRTCEDDKILSHAH